MSLQRDINLKLKELTNSNVIIAHVLLTDKKDKACKIRLHHTAMDVNIFDELEQGEDIEKMLKRAGKQLLDKLEGEKDADNRPSSN